MTNHQTGHDAEKRAARWLAENGFLVRELNWKTPRCEIDIVAEKAGEIYFIEVKYRSNEAQGSGVDYITPTKLRQMSFAAEFWVAAHNWDGGFQLAVVEANPKKLRLLTDLY